MVDDQRDPPRAASLVLASVCARCVTDLGMAHASAALASDDGLWTPAHATSDTAVDLEQRAFATGEGPWFDALHDHAPVLVPDLDARAVRRRWPAWSPDASEAGLRSVFAFPIQAGAIEAGVLVMASVDVDPLAGPRLAIALRLADVALLGVLDLLAGIEAVDGTTPQHDAVADVVRADVHQAAGMVMIQAQVPILEALARLRAWAFRTGRPIGELAEDVLTRRVRFEPDGGSAE